MPTLHRRRREPSREAPRDALNVQSPHLQARCGLFIFMLEGASARRGAVGWSPIRKGVMPRFFSENSQENLRILINLPYTESSFPPRNFNLQPCRRNIAGLLLQACPSMPATSTSPYWPPAAERLRRTNDDQARSPGLRGPRRFESELWGHCRLRLKTPADPHFGTD